VVHYFEVRGVGVGVISRGFLRELGKVVVLFIRKVDSSFLWMGSYGHARGVVNVRKLLSPHLQCDIDIAAYWPCSCFTSPLVAARIGGSAAYWSQDLLLNACLALADFLLPTFAFF
jgi:hypothetical protein